MAIPTITKMQQTAQKMLEANKKQQAASTSATQSWSTSTPTVSSTPKVTSTPKAQPSVQQTTQTVWAGNVAQIQQPSLKSLNLFKPQEQVQTAQQLSQQYWNILSTKTETKDIQNTTIPTNTIRAVTNMWWSALKAVAQTLYDQGTDYIKEKIWWIKLKAEVAKQTYNLFDTVYKWTLKEMYTDITWDIKQERESWKWVWIIRDAVANTLEWLPRWLTRAEYWIAELIDWWVDAQWATDLKNSIEDNLDYWENTRVYKRVKEAESFKDVMKNPLMYAGWTFWEMLPMFISAWVAIPTTFAQVYWETYRDYANDTSLQEAGLTDNQIRLMSLWVAWVNTLIELWSDLVEWIMPWTKTAMKWAEKKVRTTLTKPFMNIFKNVVKWWISEWVEEVLQNEIQDQVASYYGSDRDLPTRADRLTTFWISALIWWILQWWNIMVEIESHKELSKAFEEWSEAVDDIAPWVTEEEKKKLFSAIVAAEIQDQQMSDRQVNKYQNKSEQLYTERANLEEQLKTTTNETTKQSINRQIEDIDARIKSIDEIINHWQKILEEVNQKLEELSQKEELPAQVRWTINREWWENLSAQTMEDRAVAESKPINEMTDNEIIKASSYWRDMVTPSTPQEKQRQRDIEREFNRRMDEASILSDEEADAIANISFDVENMWFMKIPAILSEIDRLIDWEKDEDIKKKYEELKDRVEKKWQEMADSELYEQDTEKRDQQSILPETQINSKLFFNDLQKRLWYNLTEYALRIFEQDRQHLPWLKWVKVASLENLTQAEVMEIAKDAADVAWVLWIDFNKILENAQFWVVTLKWESVKWMEDAYWKQITRYNRNMPEILQMAIILENAWPSSFWHELMHLLDKEYQFRNWLLFTKSWNMTKKSLLKDPDFKTYNYVWKDDYWDSYREILARYAEQYVAWKLDETEYKKFTEKNRRWSDKEFNKLVPKFENILNTYFSEFRLDEWDRVAYPEIMSKINDLYYKQSQFKMDNEDDMINDLMNMKIQYDDIMWQIDEVKNETLKIELQNEATILYDNYNKLNVMKDAYLESQRVTPEQQKEIDNIPNTIFVKEWELIVPTQPEKIMYWLPYMWANIENWVNNLSEWENANKEFAESYMDADKQRLMNSKWKEIKKYRKELWQAFKDVFTPAISRIYNISPRVAWRLVTMETQTDIQIFRYREKAKWFVKRLSELKWEEAIIVKKALMDYWAKAHEHENDIAEYKASESKKLNELLWKHWFDKNDINDMFSVLDSIWNQYKESWLPITLTDMYFPRLVRDYEDLVWYMSEQVGKELDVDAGSIISQIRAINSNTQYTQEEKERHIRNLMSNNFWTVSTKSKSAEQRKILDISKWWPWMYTYYADPVEAIDHYITSMVTAIERQTFLWWIRQDANIDEQHVINLSTVDSLATIVQWLVDTNQIDKDDLMELKHSVLSVLNKKRSPKAVTKLKDVTYLTTITNFLSAINQLDDLWMTILKDRSWLKNVVKTIFKQTDIKYDDLWLEDSYEMFRDSLWVTNWLFKKSLFNYFDRLGKTSFVNTAWESMVRQYNNEDTKWNLMNRLMSMYWLESALRMWKKLKEWNYITDGQIDIEILRDLLFQLWSTQPLYTSAMPTAYLNHPWARLCYALSSFTIRRIDWLVQWTKEVNKQHWPVVAWAWLMWVSFFLAIFWAVIWDVWDFLKWKKDETFLYKWINEWIWEALKSAWWDALDSWLKIWDLSEYDLKTYKSQWLWWVLSWKIKPFVFDLWKDITQAITKHDKEQVTDLAKYVPIFWKLIYYWLWDDLDASTSSWWKPTWSKSGWWTPSWSRSGDWKPSWSRSWGDKPTWSRS